MRRLLLVLILTAAGLFGPWVPPASACSCATYDVRERLPEVDGAFVGRLIAKEEPTPADGVFSSATLARYRFSVEQPVKGDIPSPTIDVWASTSGASCGLETPVGERVGLLLDRDGDRWTSSLCGQVDPDVLIRAGQPLPPPNGVPPPAVLVGTTHGPGRMLSLDGRGRIVAFGNGAGNVSDLAFCRGNRLVAEAFSSPNEHSYHNPGVAIRRTADLTVVWERSIATGSERSMSVSDVGCREKSDAGEVLAIAVEQYSTDTTVHHEVRVLLIGPDGAPRELWRGEATGGTFAADGTAAYLSAGPDGRQLLHLDLADPAHPAARILAELPPDAGAMALSPDGRHLATVTTFRPYSSDESPPPIKAVVVDLGAAPPTVNEVQLATGSGAPYSPLWAGAERVAFVLAWGGEPVRVFDTALREVASWSGWSASTSAVVGDHLVGMTGGMVVTAPLLTGPQAQWADLESGLPGAIVAFPGGAAIGAPAEPPSTTTTAAPRANPEPAAGHAVASLPEEGGSDAGARPLLVGGAGAAVLAAAAATFIRRRRLPELPPL